MPLTLATLTLPDDLLWADEYDWTAVAQETAYTLGGALVVQEGLRLAGRTITLQGGPEHGWATRAQVEALRALAEQPNLPRTLTLADGRQFTVRFRRPSMRAVPILPYAVPESGDRYELSIFLMEV